DQGVAILLVTHSIEQAYAISDRIAVLREGRVEGQYPTTQLDRTELISTMLGKDIESMRALGSQRTEHHHAPAGPQIARADGIGREGALAPTDLELHGGEIVGIAGLRGSGRTALAHLLSGVDSPDSGRAGSST